MLAGTFVLATAMFGQTALDPAGNIWQITRADNAFVCGIFKIPPGIYTNIQCGDVVVRKLDPTGAQTLYTKTLGGHGDSGGRALTVDSSGGVYIAGYTTAPDFPVTSGAPQSKNAGPYSSQPNQSDLFPGGDTFVVKLNPDGSLAYSTFLGGSGDDIATAISVDGAGSVYVVGSTLSPDFPLTSSPLSNTPSKGFIAKISSSGQTLDFSTYFPASTVAVAVDSAGAVYVAGSADDMLLTTTHSVQPMFGGGLFDAFAAKISASGNLLVYSTYLGGSNDDGAAALAVDSQGAVWVGGATSSLDFPGTTSPGAAFLVKLSPDGSRVEVDHRFGLLNSFSSTSFIAVDARDEIYASGKLALYPGSGSIPGFQPTPNAQLAIPCTSFGNSFLYESASDGTPLYVSYLRQAGTIFLTAPGHLLLYGDEPGGISKLDLASVPAMNFQWPVNSASYAVPIGAGEIVSLFGYGIGPEAGVTAQPDSSGRYPTSLAGVQVRFNGVPAPLLYVQAGQVNTVVPNHSGIAYKVEVTYEGHSAPVLDFYGYLENPGVFGVLNEDWTVNSPTHPAKRGSIISVYATGMDMTGLNFPDGQVVPSSPLLALNFNQNGGDTVTFGSNPGTILWEGAAPGLIFGAVQINVQLPPSLPITPVFISVPMVIKSSGIYSSLPFIVYITP